MRHEGRHRRARAELRPSRRDLLFLLCRLPHQIRGRPRALSDQEGRGKAAAARHALHLPDASGDREGRARPLPDLRHGARADGRAPGDHRQPGADRFHPAAHNRRAALARAARPRHGEPCLRHRSPPLPVGERQAMAAIADRYPGGAVLRLAVLRARLGFAPLRPAQHVHPHCHGHRRGVSL